MTSSSNDWHIPYGNVSDTQFSPSEILETYLKANWSLEHPPIYWKYWDGHHDYTIKTEESNLTSEPLTNEWTYFSYRSTVLVHLFGREIKAGNSIPDNFTRTRQHLENLIKSRRDALQQNGIFNMRFLRSSEGPPEESFSAGSSHRVYHVIIEVELFYTKRGALGN